MKKLILVVALVALSSLSTYADTLTDFLKASVGKKVIVYLKDKKDVNDSVTGTLDKVDDKFITVLYSSTGDYVFMRDAIASIYIYKK